MSSLYYRICIEGWSPGKQRYDHSDNLFLQQKSSKT